MFRKIPGSKTFFHNRYEVLICLFLVVAAISVYWQVRNHEFVNYDDNLYVSDNPYVKSGLTAKGIKWSFTAIRFSNWHPVTWFSHMMDSQIFGMNPGGHHLSNLFLHIANILLLLHILGKMTGNIWSSGFVAALFALHPLQVESVAWVAERKNVLSTFFWMLTMWSYLFYVERPGTKRYLPVLFFYALGLMAKPMLVSLPFVLLLLDYWPLQRFQLGRSGEKHRNRLKTQIFDLIKEKIPLLILAIASGIVTVLVQLIDRSVGSLSAYPLSIRIANALISYAKYIGKLFYPDHLACFYPYPGMLPLWQVAGAFVLLVAISSLSIWSMKRQPYFVVGWLWFLGTLVPVIGLVQVGYQAMADRYTYVPFIGLFIIISWGVPELLKKWRSRKIGIAATALALLPILIISTWIQAGYWKDSISLFEHALAVTENNYIAHNNLGITLAEQGRFSEAIEQYAKALQISPDYEKAHNNLGFALAAKGRNSDAIKHYTDALRIKPDYPEAHNNLGIALARQGTIPEAIGHYEEALRLQPDFAQVHNNWGLTLFEQLRVKEAVKHYQKALQIDPAYVTAHYNLGNLLLTMGRAPEAVEHFKKVLSRQPDFIPAMHGLAVAYSNRHEFREALSLFMKILEIHPENTESLYNVACMYARLNKVEASLLWLRTAIDRGYDNWELLKTDRDLDNIRGVPEFREIIGSR